MQWQTLHKLVRLKAKFALTSLVATSIDIAIYALMIYVVFAWDGTPATPRQLIIATVCGTSVGMVINFLLQKKYVFQLQRGVRTAFLGAMAVSVGGIFLDAMIVGFLGRFAVFYAHPLLQLLPKLIAKGLVFFYNFYCKRYVFEGRFVER